MHPAYQSTLAKPGKSRAAVVAGHLTRYLHDRLALQPRGSPRVVQSNNNKYEPSNAKAPSVSLV